MKLSPERVEEIRVRAKNHNLISTWVTIDDLLNHIAALEAEIDAALEAMRQVNKIAMGNFYLPETREGLSNLANNTNPQKDSQ